VEEGVEVVDVDKFVQKQPAIVNGFVTLQPKNNLVFPLADNPRFPVSDDDIMHFCAIVELAYTDRIQKYVLYLSLFLFVLLLLSIFVKYLFSCLFRPLICFLTYHSYLIVYLTYHSSFIFFQFRNYALKYHGVHCSFISLGQTLMRDGHIDNFLIPCFRRKLFEDNHPSKSGRHYFFSYVGV
jgi:hypothetical protein